ncbi:phosphoglycolate phosphatase [Mesorhizobium sp. J18]|uniref:HAD family hydrolase n=1 Tax=Mesorhizobium sp. J18 TaxID=935263 RepID=UPI00119B6E40|nr:HAD family hydrolase [Mesorhizobium sp. J18]TWG99046.1 phosphoglycolate phosphatase [Mesorhizobium sp. J18]
MEELPARAAILFDLDGTLTDPFIGITRSIQYAMEALGRAAPAADDLRWCIGPPLHASFPKLLGTDDQALVEEAVRLYRERYSDIGKFENSLIEGIPETLSRLADGGHQMFVATSKLSTYANEIIEHFGLRKYFKALYGSGLDGRHADKTELIAHLLESESLDPERCTMIGDRSHDVLGANANKTRSIGVLWGYGDRQELESAGAGLIVERPQELPGLVASRRLPDGRFPGYQ